MTNYFQNKKDHPQHISVGAVVVNSKGEIMAHYFSERLSHGYWPDLGLKDFYILMRETLNPNETLEQALHRGLMEEFGVEAEIVDYIGSQCTSVNSAKHGWKIDKTTLYFLCKFISQDVSKRSKEDIEGETDIEWRTKEFLISKMKDQAKKYGRGDLDESSILEKI